MTDIGSVFIAARKPRAVVGYRQVITECSSDDIVGVNFDPGLPENDCHGSIRNANMESTDPSLMVNRAR